jgi:hypothetical protein
VKIFCDAFKYTVPGDNTGAGLIAPNVLEVVDGAGLMLAFNSPEKALYRVAAERGAFVATKGRGFIALSVSGQVLERLRDMSLLDSLLAAIGSDLHKVTGLHATGDQDVDGAAVVAAVLAKGDAGEVCLSRKAVLRGQVERVLSLDDRGVLTGTAYLGSKAAGIRGVVYDKRHERMCNAGVDPGPRVRYEMRFGRHIGMTLRDVWDPTALFYHAAAPDLLPQPDDVAPWSPHAEGFTLPPMRTRTDIQKMKALAESSEDVGRMCRYARGAGDLGLDFLLRYVTDRFEAEASAHLEETAQSPP